MDIYCPVKGCGEPWDSDELHDTRYKSYQIATQHFATKGCEVFDTKHGNADTLNTTSNPASGLFASEASAILFDILGDDVDAIAAEMEDLGF